MTLNPQEWAEAFRYAAQYIEKKNNTAFYKAFTRGVDFVERKKTYYELWLRDWISYCDNSDLKFIVDSQRRFVIAISPEGHYASSLCRKNDKFDADIGKALAASRLLGEPDSTVPCQLQKKV